MNDEERRSKNVLIYGLEEKEDESAEDLCRQLRSVYKNAGKLEAPDSTDGYFRVGTKQPGKIRPVKIQMQRTADAEFLLNNARCMLDPTGKRRKKLLIRNWSQK